VPEPGSASTQIPDRPEPRDPGGLFAEGAQRRGHRLVQGRVHEQQGSRPATARMRSTAAAVTTSRSSAAGPAIARWRSAQERKIQPERRAAADVMLVLTARRVPGCGASGLVLAGAAGLFCRSSPCSRAAGSVSAGPDRLGRRGLADTMRVIARAAPAALPQLMPVPGPSRLGCDLLASSRAGPGGRASTYLRFGYPHGGCPVRARRALRCR
jgi:hypothetical protein